MKPKYIYKDKRKKAFLGAALIGGLISGIASIASSAISANQQKKALEKQQQALDEQQALENNIAENNNLAAVANNRGYIDAYQEKMMLRCGGRKKALLGANTNNNTYYDRRNMYKIGGRKRGKC